MQGFGKKGENRLFSSLDYLKQNVDISMLKLNDLRDCRHLEYKVHRKSTTWRLRIKFSLNSLLSVSNPSSSHFQYPHQQQQQQQQQQQLQQHSTVLHVSQFSHPSEIGKNHFCRGAVAQSVEYPSKVPGLCNTTDWRGFEPWRGFWKKVVFLQLDVAVGLQQPHRP